MADIHYESSADEVWEWISARSYADQLQGEDWQYITGELLLTMSYDQLRRLVPSDDVASQLSADVEYLQQQNGQPVEQQPYDGQAPPAVPPYEQGDEQGDEQTYDYQGDAYQQGDGYQDDQQYADDGQYEAGQEYDQGGQQGYAETPQDVSGYPTPPPGYDTAAPAAAAVGGGAAVAAASATPAPAAEQQQQQQSSQPKQGKKLLPPLIMLIVVGITLIVNALNMVINAAVLDDVFEGDVADYNNVVIFLAVFALLVWALAFAYIFQLLFFSHGQHGMELNGGALLLIFTSLLMFGYACKAPGVDTVGGGDLEGTGAAAVFFGIATFFLNLVVASLGLLAGGAQRMPSF